MLTKSRHQYFGYAGILTPFYIVSHPYKIPELHCQWSSPQHLLRGAAVSGCPLCASDIAALLGVAERKQWHSAVEREKRNLEQNLEREESREAPRSGVGQRNEGTNHSLAVCVGNVIEQSLVEGRGGETAQSPGRTWG